MKNILDWYLKHPDVIISVDFNQTGMGISLGDEKIQTGYSYYLPDPEAVEANILNHLDELYSKYLIEKEKGYNV